jgi:site-specific DNA recombinase
MAEAPGSGRRQPNMAQRRYDRHVKIIVPIDEAKIRAFAALMRAKILEGDTPFRRAYIRSVIDQVEVGDTEIRIIGRRIVLERLVMGGSAAPAGVPSFVRNWRPGRDSNP